MTPLQVLIAPDSFKGTLTAAEAAEAIAAGVRDELPAAALELKPLADGGEGSVDALIRAGFTAVDVDVTGPNGETVRSVIASRDAIVVVELANTCGLLLLPDGRLDPMRSNTLGLGDAIRRALDDTPDEVVVCVGGSASTDGGAGLLVALGARLLDAQGRELAPCGATLTSVATVDLSGLDARLAATHFTVATDVTNPLVGPLGAARVFAPQKGATSGQVVDLEAGLAHWSALLAELSGIDASEVRGSGAAGGAPLALLCIANANVRPAAEFIADAIGLDAAGERADIVITGEGAFDAQSLMGKGAGRLAQLSIRQGHITLVLAGRIDIALPGAASFSLLDMFGENATTDPATALREATRRALRDQATSIDRLARPKK